MLCANLCDPKIRGKNLDERELKLALSYLNFVENPDKVEKVNTFAQTFENEAISRVTSGVIDSSQLIPAQLTEFMQSLPNDKMPVEFWGNHEEFITSNLGDVCLLITSNATVERKNSRAKRILETAPHTSPKALSAKLFHKSMLHKMPKTWETLANKQIINASRLANREKQGDDNLNIAQFFEWGDLE